MAALADRIKKWGAELGFQAVGIADVDLSAREGRLADWLGMGWHGEMDYMARHGALRARPAQLVPGTLRVISCRMDYLQDNPATSRRSCWTSAQPTSRATRAAATTTGDARPAAEAVRSDRGRGRPFAYRAFADSAPVMEVELAARAGIGWRGKHTLLLDRQGSWFFSAKYIATCLLFVILKRKSLWNLRTVHRDLSDAAITAPYRLDARRCISYLTIEHKSAIPEELRPLIGKPRLRLRRLPARLPLERLCPPSDETDFQTRNGLDHASLVELFGWSAEEFDCKMQGSPIRRIGYERWLRNLAVGLGMPRPRQRSFPHCSTGPTTLPRWCASTCAGR